jgi:phosphomannomutase
MHIDPSIFKAYDIRGVYPAQLAEDQVYALARAYATVLLDENPGRHLTVAVGSDMRTSSPSLKARVIAGLTESGIDVADVGLASTPTFYFAVAHSGFDGGLQVSASHNPKEYNGLKLVRRGGAPISGETGIKEMQQICEAESFVAKALVPGTARAIESIVKTEVEEQSKGFDLGAIAPFRIAFDGSNGMGNVDMAELFGRLPQCTVVKINDTLDGTFPGHPADPMVAENSAELRALVVAEHCDVGIIPDGDADRYFFVDEKGGLIGQYILRAIMASIELREHPGATVAYDIRPGRITRDVIEQLGGRGIVTPVGHSLIKEEMLREGAIFGGESSGHYYYALPYGTFEAPVVLVLKFLKFLGEQNKPLSQVVAPYMVYSNSGEINLKLPSREVGLQKIEEVKVRFADGAQNLLDGVSVEYPTWWFNVRLSNTEPLIRLTVEAVDVATMEQKKEQLLELLA